MPQNNEEIDPDVGSNRSKASMPKFEDYHRTVVGYRGTKRSTALKVVSGEISMVRSENEYDWLGSGVYYWEYAPKQAWAWAERKRKNEKWPKDEDVAVIASMIRLGFCFDLLDPDNILEIKLCYHEYMRFCEWLGQEPRKNFRHRKYL